MAVFAIIFFYIRIEQIQRDTTDFYLPDTRADISVGIGHLYYLLLAVFAVDWLDGHLVKIIFRIAFGLPTVGIKRLAKIPLAVEQADAD